MNTVLEKKIRQYSLLAGPALVSVGMANGQVVYHDVVPDKIYKDSIAGDYYTIPGFLDLDGDGTFDAEFAVWSSVQSDNGPNKVHLVAARQYGFPGNAVMGYTNLFTASFCSTALPQYCPYAVDLNEMIEPAMNFWAVQSTGNLGTLVRYFKDLAPPNNVLGQWNDVSDKYFGLRFTGGDGLLHYGWIRMDVRKSPASLTIKDYGYELQHNVPVLAGDQGNTAVPGADPSFSFRIICDGATLSIHIRENMNMDATVTLTNALGQHLLIEKLRNPDTLINVGALAKGVCLVNIHYGPQTYSRKILLK